MPLFDYHCSTCGRTFEALVRGERQPECPDCHSTAIERMIPLPARPANGSGDGATADFSKFGPPPGGCCGGSCAH
jgi:putative FmdB family regulatory protein